jgi:hypothetical protein
MTMFEDRKKGHESKFALDAEMRFKAESRRNKMLAEWAAGKLGLTGVALEDYVKDVRRADLKEKGDDDVLRKVKADLDVKGLGIGEAELREVMDTLLHKAIEDVKQG